MSTGPAAPDPPLRTWTLDLPYRTPPLSLNGARGNHYARARTVKQVRRLAGFLAQQARIPPLRRCSIELHYAPTDRRRRDPHNLVATLKPIEDGIVDAGVVPDDTAEYVPPSTPVIDPPTGKAGRMYVVVRELVS
jgi:crossover junction endodeoxyribonuclease RusA